MIGIKEGKIRVFRGMEMAIIAMLLRERLIARRKHARWTGRWLTHGITDDLSCGIRPHRRRGVRILIRHEAIRHFRIARKGIAARKPATSRPIPARPQPDIAALLQFPGEAEGCNGGALRDTPGVVASDGLWHARIVQRRTHAAQRIHTLPRSGAAALLRKEALSGIAVDITLRAVAQDLDERDGEILRGACGHAVCRLRHERAVAIGGVAGAAHRQHAAQRVVGVGLAPITEQIPGGVIAPALHLIGGIIAVILGARAVDPHARAVPGQIVGVRLRCAGVFAGAGQALQPVVIADCACGQARNLLNDLPAQSTAIQGVLDAARCAALVGDAGQTVGGYDLPSKSVI